MSTSPPLIPLGDTGDERGFRDEMCPLRTERKSYRPGSLHSVNGEFLFEDEGKFPEMRQGEAQVVKILSGLISQSSLVGRLTAKTILQDT